MSLKSNEDKTKTRVLVKEREEIGYWQMESRILKDCRAAKKTRNKR